MREIKFRAWDKYRKVFAKQILTFKFDRDWNINLIVYIDKTNKTRAILEEDKIYCNEFELMQYTWLKDKNWKEIYEGDIVKSYVFDWPTYDPSNWYPIKKIDIVKIIPFMYLKWDRNILINWYNCNTVLYASNCEYEIIWNIYENKDLLTIKK